MPQVREYLRLQGAALRCRISIKGTGLGLGETQTIPLSPTMRNTIQTVLVALFTVSPGLLSFVRGSTLNDADNYAINGQANVNVLSADTSGISLTFDPVATQTEPASQTVNEGQSATFSIAVSGVGPFSYQWQHNGATISGANSAALVISNATTSSAGTYQVIVLDALGNPTSASFTLTVDAQDGTPAMPPWALAALAALLVFFMGKALPRDRGRGGQLGITRSLIALLAGFGACCLQPKVHAQQMDNPVYYPVNFQSTMVMTSPSADQDRWYPYENGYPIQGTFSSSVTDGTGTVITSSCANSYVQNTNNTSTGAMVTALLTPGKDYVFTMNVTAGAVGSDTATVAGTVFLSVAGPGVTILVNGAQLNTYPGMTGSSYGSLGSNTKAFTLRISVPLGKDLRGGEAGSIVPDKPIWAVGLGKMRNGVSAGAVGFRQADFSASNFFTPNALYYYSVDPNEVSVITFLSDANGPHWYLNFPQPGDTLLQVLSREVLLNVSTITANVSYKIDVYPSSQLPGTRTIVGYSGLYHNIPVYGPYDLAGSPVATYTISKINGGNGVDITWLHDGVTWDTSLSKNGSTWTQTDWHVQGTSASRYVTTTYNGTTSATVLQTGPNAAGTGQESPMPWSKAFAAFSWGNELTQKQVGSLTTSYDYYTATDGNGGFQGMLKSQINNDGSWALYQYNSSGLVQTVLRPWLDGPTSPSGASTANSAYETFTYDAADFTYLDSHVTYAPGGVQLAKTTWSYNFSSGSFTDSTGTAHTLMTSTRNDFFNSNSLTTVSQFFRKDDANTYLRSQPVSVASPNGSQDSFAYYVGTWNSSSQTFTASTDGTKSDRLIVTLHGQTTVGTGSDTGAQVSSWSYGGIAANIAPLYLVPNLSTFTETVVDTTGRVVFTAENVFTSANTLNRFAGTLTRFDSLGRVKDEVDIARSNGTNEFKTTHLYVAGLLDTVTGPDGVPTQMTYDGLLRLTSKTIGVSGNASYPAWVMQYRYDGADRLAWQGIGASPSAWTTLTYEAAGRTYQVAEPGPSGTLTTTYSYPNPQTTTITLPNSATATTAQYLDGRPKSVTGSAQVPVYCEYVANSSGLLIRTEHMSPTGSNSSQTLGWTEVQQDYLGRTTLESTPAWNWTTNAANIVDVSSTYDSTSGNLTGKHTTYRSGGGQLLPDHLYSYDAAGRPTQEGLDVDNSVSLTAVSTDRINAYNLTFTKDSAGWTQVATVSTAPDISAGLTVTTTATTRLTGFAYSGGVWGMGDVTIVDPSGRSSEQLDSVTPGSQTRTSTRQVGGVTTIAQTVWINGLLANTISSSGVREEYLYDSLGRLQTDHWRFDGTNYNVGKTIAYYGNTQYQHTVTDQGSTTTYAYAWGTDGSRTISATDALNHTNYTMLNPMGLPWCNWGSAANPVQISYDALGRRQSITTWRSGDFTGSTWPAPSGGDLTKWTLDTATGLLNTKTFADTNHVDFSYTALGQVATRQWARTIPNGSTRVTATYSYFDGSAAAGGSGFRTQELREVDYNDGTPSVQYTYARSGALATVQDCAGTRKFYYRGPDAKLNYEQLDNFYNARRITLGYETGASVGRCNLVEVGTASNPSADYANTVSYTDTRVTTVDGSSNGNPERVFQIGYVPYSDHVHQVSQSTTGYNYQRTYELTQDLVQTVTNQYGTGSTMVAQFAYQYNAVNQASSVAKTGSIFSLYGSGAGIVTNFGYDSRSELTSEQSYLGTNPSNTSNPLSGRALGSVAYDNLGNRTSLGLNGNSAIYTPNGVNQYTSRTNPGVVTVTGAADASAAVAVNGQSVGSSNQQGGYFRQDVNVNNSSGTNLTPMRVTTGSNLDQAEASLKPSYLPSANENFGYDLDGNLTDDDHWHYTYDAENRLSGMTPQAAALSAGARDQRLTFSYDYRGRRVEKKVELGEVNGFLGQYFSGTDFQSVHHLQTDGQLWFTGLGSNFPGAGQASTNFSTYWSGYLVPPVTGNYQFRFTVDDRFRLWINGQLVQQSWHDQGATAYITVPIALNAGDHVFVQAEYYQDGGGAFAGLEWNVPGQGWQVIPQSSVFSPPLTGSGTWRTTSDTIFLYDQNNLIEEIQGGAITRSYTWGLDISESEQGAGGTGGLLMINDSGQNYFPVYDQMGNVHGLIRSSDGSLVATYEYNAFGEVIRQHGTYAATNSLGWNTKYTDRETGLVYFGQRFYNPNLGRFVNRDPIEEEGGWNLYGMCGNDPVNNYDFLGYETDDASGSFQPPGPYLESGNLGSGSYYWVTQGGMGYGDFNFTSYPDFPTATPGQSFQPGVPTAVTSFNSTQIAWLISHGFLPKNYKPPGKTTPAQPPAMSGSASATPTAAQFYNPVELDLRLATAGNSFSGSIFDSDQTFYSFGFLRAAPNNATNGGNTVLDKLGIWWDNHFGTRAGLREVGEFFSSHSNSVYLPNPATQPLPTTLSSDDTDPYSHVSLRLTASALAGNAAMFYGINSADEPSINSARTLRSIAINGQYVGTTDPLYPMSGVSNSGAVRFGTGNAAFTLANQGLKAVNQATSSMYKFMFSYISDGRGVWVLYDVSNPGTPTWLPPGQARAVLRRLYQGVGVQFPPNLH